MINAKDLIDDLQEWAKANQGKRNDLTFNSAEPKVNKAPVHKNEEIAKLAVYLRILFNILRKQKKNLYYSP